MDRAASTKRDVLERMLFDESEKPTDLPLPLLEYITDGFSDDKQIGEGGFAKVYKGMLRNGIIAVKKMSKNHLYENKFNLEVECLMKAKHKNVVRFLGYCADTQGKMEMYNGKHVMAEVPQRLLCFEYLPKGSLHDYITDASRELKWKQCYQIIKGICAGLHYLHEIFIVHSDLKPTNILFDDNMVPKIADFGLSRCFDESQSHVLTSKLYGTLGYIAPEVIYYKRITFKSDMFSLGVIINEILSGEKMYPEHYDVLKSWGNRLDKLHREKQLEQLRVCAEIGKECTDNEPRRRLDAQAVVRRLDEVDIIVDSMSDEADIVNRSIVRTDMSNLSIAQEEIHRVEEPVDGNQQLFGAIGRELSLKCLLRLSRSYYGTVASLNWNFRSLVRNGEIYRLRRLTGVAEHWFYVGYRGRDWKAYNLERRRWIQVPRMPGTEFCAGYHSLAVGTDLFVFGNHHREPNLLRYSILTNSWIQTTDTTNFFHRYWDFGSTTVGQKAYLAGGYDQYDYRVSRAAAMYDSEEFHRYWDFGSTTVEQKAYLAGGYDQYDYRVSRAAAMYDSEEKVWEPLPSMNRGRRLCSVAFMDRKLYVISGRDDNNKTLTCGEEYDFERGSWRVIDNMLSGDLRINGVAYSPVNFLVAVVNNELYEADNCSKNVNKYDMQNNRWITLGKLPQSFDNVNGFKACGDKLIIAGSFSVASSIHSFGKFHVEIYYWVPSEQPPAWNLIAGHPCESVFSNDFTVMSC